MTVAQLCRELTNEELIAWAAFYELRNEEQEKAQDRAQAQARVCLLYTSPSPRDRQKSRIPSSA